ncbi:MAG: acyl carrier protein [Flavobacterium sp.]
MEEKFLSLVKEVLEIEDREIQLSDNFRDFDEWDSLANLSFVAMIDDEYGVVIDSQKFKEMKSLQEVFDAVQES